MRTALVLLAFGALAADAGAQSLPWTRSVGMAGADFALTRGYAAVESNPANLFVEDSVGFSFGSSVHGGRVLVTGADLFELADIATSAGVGASSLLDGVPAEGLRIDAISEGITASTLAGILDIPDPSGGTGVPTFGFSYRNGGLVIRHHTVLSALMSRELVDLAVNGFNPEQINEYAARNTHFRSFTLTSATAGLAKRFGKLGAGVSVRYVYGRKLLSGRVFEPEIDVDAELLSASAAAIETRGGNGWVSMSASPTASGRVSSPASRCRTSGSGSIGARTSSSLSRPSTRTTSALRTFGSSSADSEPRSSIPTLRRWRHMPRRRTSSTSRSSPA